MKGAGGCSSDSMITGREVTRGVVLLVGYRHVFELCRQIKNGSFEIFVSKSFFLLYGLFERARSITLEDTQIVLLLVYAKKFKEIRFVASLIDSLNYHSI